MTTIQLRRVARIVNGGTPTPATENWDGGIPWVTPVDLAKVDGGAIGRTDRTLTDVGLASGSTLVPEDSIILSTRAPIGYTALATVPVAFNQGCKALVPVGDSVPRFLQYVLVAATNHLKAMGSGSTFLELGNESLAQVPVPSVGVEEQRRIADFLDDRVARIDQIIAARRQQSVALKVAFDHARQERIRGKAEASRPVPGWLGRVDARWPDRRLGQLVEFFAGAGFPPDEQGLIVGDYPFVKVSDLAGANLLREVDTAANWITADNARRLGAHPAPSGTILFPKVGAALLTNSRAVADRPVVFDNNVMGVKFRHGDTRYWFHVLSCVDMGEIANPGPVPSIGREGVAELRVPLPPLAEQSEVGRELDGRLVATAQRQDQVRRSIDLLQEYKQSLITAAVTGELDVTTASTRIPEQP